MKHHPIQISIPQPCSEDWNEMTPQEQGRFCDSCQKCVVDFTGYSDKELLFYFNTYSTKNLCGRFSHTQLNRKIFIPPTKKKYIQWVMSLGFIVFLTNFFGLNVKAQEPTKKEWRQDNKCDSSKKQNLTTNEFKTLPENAKASEEIEKLPTRNTNDIVSTTPTGFPQTHNGDSISISGARSEATLYIIDGLQINGSKGINLPSQNTFLQPEYRNTPAKYSNKDKER